jgi:hypothetical protein
MLTIVHAQQRQLDSEAQTFFAEEPRPSGLARIVAVVAALDAACVVFALLAA